MKSQFVVSLMRMFKATGYFRPDIDLNFFTMDTSILPYSRTEIARGALEWGAEYLLWIDADQTFPHDTLIRLLSCGKDVVAAIIPRRNPPHIPNASIAGELVSIGTGLQEVGRVGLGVCLVRKAVFARLELPYFRIGLNGSGFVGEDAVFCDAAKAAGFRIWVDHDLSRQVGHLTEHELRWSENENTVLPASGAQ